ncbi:hypothetical protein [Cupriavidus sp. DF5525]|uniref:hypothetical protein n=1 Tax=Cupriavidus sp. DF5525 TaxID=3160989 RepID=UPI0032E0133D
MANHLASILSVAMMLRFSFLRETEARVLVGAVAAALRRGRGRPLLGRGDAVFRRQKWETPSSRKSNACKRSLNPAGSEPYASPTISTRHRS